MKFKNLHYHLLAILFFLLITVIYFNPILFGEKMKPGDAEQFEYSSKELKEYSQKTGKTSLWTNSMFGGMPAYTIWCSYPGNIATYMLKFFKAILPSPANILFMFLIASYILFCCMNVGQILSVIGAIAFAFTSYNFVIIDVGHFNKAMAVAFMLPVLAGILMTLRGNLKWGGIFTAFAVALEIRCNHVQISYYLLLSVLVIILIESIYSYKRKNAREFVKAIGILAVAAILGIAPNTSMLWCTYEYSQESTRGEAELADKQGVKEKGLKKDYVFDWSYGIGETMTFLIPDYYGGVSERKISKNSKTYKALIRNNVPPQRIKNLLEYAPIYWGDQPYTSGPAYMGAVICLLFVFGLFVVKGPLKWWTLSVFLLTVMIAWGKNFLILNDLLYNYMPMFKKFRSITMIHVISGLMMVLLSVFALKKLLDTQNDIKENLRALLKSTVIVGGIAFFFAFLPGVFLNFTGFVDEVEMQNWPQWLLAAIRADRRVFLVYDAYRSLFFVLLAALVIWLLIKNKLQIKYALGCLILLILADMWMVDKRYLNDEDFVDKQTLKQNFIPFEADLAVMEDTDPNYRVLDLTGPAYSDARPSFFHKSVGGYHSAKLKRYDDLIKKQLTEENQMVLNMLNTRYIIVRQKNNPSESIPTYNDSALGNAWFVTEYKLVENANEEIDALTNFDPAKTVIIDKKFANYVSDLNFRKNDKNKIRLASYKPDELIYQCKTQEEKLAVFSEIYYEKGWNAYIDNKLTPHIRVNYVLRALKIPDGVHKIVFKFEPTSYYAGEKISLASSILLVSLLLFFGYKELNLKNKNQ